MVETRHRQEMVVMVGCILPMALGGGSVADPPFVEGNLAAHRVALKSGSDGMILMFHGARIKQLLRTVVHLRNPSN
uniref:Uncharacterized protein n=1 Tax=Oryza sativa subsp. japonica TaxID=39947 RepID=Q6YY80_ORYSJ|nr:hypothetical protein [Oryza sativa Japonica Group]